MVECDFCGCELMDLSEAVEYETDEDEDDLLVCQSCHEEASK